MRMKGNSGVRGRGSYLTLLQAHIQEILADGEHLAFYALLVAGLQYMYSDLYDVRHNNSASQDHCCGNSSLPRIYP